MGGPFIQDHVGARVTQATARSFQQLSARWSRILASATTSTLGAALELCLEDLGGYCDVDVAFATLVDDDDRVSDDWHWVRPGKAASSPAVGSRLQDTFGSGIEFLKLGHPTVVSDIEALELSPSERALATTNRLRAVMVVPVQISSALIGVAGLLVMDEPRSWDKKIVEQVQLLAELLVRAVIRTRDRGALALADARARRIAEFIPDGLVLAATDGTINWVSPSLARMTDVTARSLEGRQVIQIAHPDDRMALQAALDQSVIEPTNVSMRIHRRIDWRWCVASLRLASEPDTSAPDEIVIVLRDDHERQLQTEALQRATQLDPLTLLLNRAGLSSALDDLATDDASVVVAYCDIDDFKSVNDRESHEAGDEALRAVARSLVAAVRPCDVVARLGGDEFAVVVEGGESLEDAVALGERLLATAMDSASNERGVTLSIGVVGPGPARAAGALLDAADRAMYEAKKAGKHRFVARSFDPS
jgi:diguanylate cyclase (GGDEF)-like protein/PAS domain S-box-containing protein